MWEYLKQKWEEATGCPEPVYPSKPMEEVKVKEYDPKIEMGDEYWNELFEIDVLKGKIETYIATNYENITNVKIYLHITEGWCEYSRRSIRVYMDCEWEYGPSDDIIKPKINELIDTHIYSIKRAKTNSIKIDKTLYYSRLYSDPLILRVAEKYVRCVNKCVPINLATISLIKIKDISARDFAITELNSIDYIDPNNLPE